MSVRTTFALAGASLALAAAPTAAATAAAPASSASGPAVSVRVEGVKKTLLAPTTTHGESGSITKGSGSCSGWSALGALDAATKHRWNGTYSSGLGIEINQILGETDVFAHGHWWEIFVNNRPASLGACDIKLRAGERLLFAAVPSKGNVALLGLRGPSKVTAGRAFTLHVVAYDAKGRAKPVSGVHVAGASKPSDAHGLVTVTESHRGTAHFVASGTGYIRSAPLAVKVG